MSGRSSPGSTTCVTGAGSASSSAARSRRCSSSSTATTTRTPAELTPAEQDRVVDECFQCKLCYVNCPYVPGQSEWDVDFPRLMLRADAMRHATGDVPGPAPAHQRRDGSHRSRRQARQSGPRPLANATVDEARARSPQGDPKADRGVGGAAPAAVRPAAVHHLVQAAPEGADRAAGRARWPCSPPASSSTRTRASGTTS